jgi:hypothetical protein
VPEFEQVLSKSLKGKFKRWISSSNAMNSAKEEFQGHFVRVCIFPLPLCQPSRQTEDYEYTDFIISLSQTFGTLTDFWMVLRPLQLLPSSAVMHGSAYKDEKPKETGV